MMGQVLEIVYGKGMHFRNMNGQTRLYWLLTIRNDKDTLTVRQHMLAQKTQSLITLVRDWKECLHSVLAYLSVLLR